MGNMENMENMEMFSGSPTEMFYEAKNIPFPPDTLFRGAIKRKKLVFFGHLPKGGGGVSSNPKFP